MTGSCDGLAELRESLAAHPELDLRGWCEDIEEAAGLLGRGPAAVLHANADPETLDAELEAIRVYTDAPVVLLTDTAPLPDADVAAAMLLPDDIDQVAHVVAGLRGGSEPGDATATQNRFFTVFSPKGGTGKSVIATNLGVALALNGVSTLLVDLGLELGDDALMLGADPRRTIYDLVAAPGALDEEKLRGYATRHASGLDVLPAPLRPRAGRAGHRGEGRPDPRRREGRVRRGRGRHAGIVPRDGARRRRPDATRCSWSASWTWRRSRTSGSRSRRSSSCASRRSGSRSC